ncbi:FAD-dependent oxidoreductase [Pseudomonas sp. Root68]|uniref:NAD(P)/FAD-dependent oxidoreductase n=1 Tax=unclassified Pseudomonas TaxID=196821 RepID=UPI0006FB4A35|nr:MULTISPECIES: NAD(P)/FAD-dependent oxidoreductase [unclassified Pseudomonas]KRB00978.1 FAD-dependent oxidoreductase [Pseudomonas sp. Root68]KRB69542.1 FAD-dependent oxidoreductase [Pseudomonas sp. Root71]
MNVDIQSVVVGAGVVGLAVARALARSGREVLVVEAGGGIGTGISSRNSEVIHAGIYYPGGSLKARLCVEGKQRLYAYCDEHGVDYRRVGKLIVATDEQQRAALQRLLQQGRVNGVDDLQWLDGPQARELEPALSCVAALWSPSTGIVDSHGLMLALQGDAQRLGATLALHTPLLSARCIERGLELHMGGNQPMTLCCRELINCAGLSAPEVASSIVGLPGQFIPRAYLCKGSYFSFSGRAPFLHLVYPAPESAGLGVHMTLDLGGQARFGPDVEWVEHIDYRVEPHRAEGFYQAIRRYWPGLPDNSLQPAYSGIRPKISGPTEPAADFLISARAEHGVPGLVNLFGIESPGLTSCLALAEHVVKRLDDR